MACGLYGGKFGRVAREAEPETRIDSRQAKARCGNEQIGTP